MINIVASFLTKASNKPQLNLRNAQCFIYLQISFDFTQWRVVVLFLSFVYCYQLGETPCGVSALCCWLGRLWLFVRRRCHNCPSQSVRGARTVWPIIATFFTKIQTDLLNGHTGYDVTGNFRSVERKLLVDKNTCYKYQNHVSGPSGGTASWQCRV